MDRIKLEPVYGLFNSKQNDRYQLWSSKKSDSKAARTLVLIIIFNDDLCSLTDVTFVYFFLTSTYLSIYGKTKSNSPMTDDLL